MQLERSAAILQIHEGRQRVLENLQNRGRAFILHERTKYKNQSLFLHFPLFITLFCST